MKSVAAHFGAAARTYEAAADIQRRVALDLAGRIAGLDLPPRPSILEIGCGTGLLSRELATRLDPAAFYLSDIAPPMLAACRNTLPGTYLAMDGELPCFGPGAGFDLICASLSFQWFRDPAGAFGTLARCLAPGGHLAFATLARDSFHEWRQALAEAGLPSGVPRYPSLDAWRGFMPGKGVRRIEEKRLTQHHADGRTFLAALKRIGAGKPAEGYRPLPPGDLRRVLRRFEGGIDITYHVVYGIYARTRSAKTDLS